MADLSDVETALVDAIVASVYANGVTAPSVTGGAVTVYRGWPVTRGLQADLVAGNVHVSVFAMPGATRDTTRWGAQLRTSAGQAGLIASVAESNVRFGGTGSAGQIAGILVDGVPFVYRMQAGDTPELLAAILGDAVREVRPCLVSGASLSFPGAVRVVARVAADATGTVEWGRQEQGFRLSVWAPDPTSRDAVCSAIARGLVQRPFLGLTDGGSGRLRYRSTASIDDDQDVHLYRRDLVYDVEYPTTVDVSMPSMLFGDIGLNSAANYA